MRLILSFLLILSAQAFLSLDIKAQTPAPASPSITVRDEEGYEVEGYVCIGKITFTVNVAGSVPTDKPTFNWTIVAGKIISGQGTKAITVETGENFGVEITATVEVGGVSALSTKRDNRASATVKVNECFCPNLHINCPTDILWPGTPTAVSLSISGGSPHWNPKYKWQVSDGRIISGQGTPEISVETLQLAGQTIIVTVEVDGMRPECPKSVSCNLTVIGCGLPPSARKFDEFDDLRWTNEEERLANLGIQLQQESDAMGHIIIYGPRRVAQHLARARKFLVEKRGIDAKRIVLVNGGFNKKTKVELWVAPTGSSPPEPDPNF
jgi:hypothetical protein